MQENHSKLRIPSGKLHHVDVFPQTNLSAVSLVGFFPPHAKWEREIHPQINLNLGFPSSHVSLPPLSRSIPLPPNAHLSPRGPFDLVTSRHESPRERKVLYIPYNLLLKPGEFNKPEWIKKGSLGVDFFSTAQRRFGLAGKKWGKIWKLFQVGYCFHRSLVSVVWVKKAPFFCSFAFALQEQLGLSLGH